MGACWQRGQHWHGCADQKGSARGAFRYQAAKTACACARATPPHPTLPRCTVLPLLLCTCASTVPHTLYCCTAAVPQELLNLDMCKPVWVSTLAQPRQLTQHALALGGGGKGAGAGGGGGAGAVGALSHVQIGSWLTGFIAGSVCCALLLRPLRPPPLMRTVVLL